MGRPRAGCAVDQWRFGDHYAGDLLLDGQYFIAKMHTNPLVFEEQKCVIYQQSCASG